MENYYSLLQVDKNADQEVISKVFKYHIKKNHPDLFTGEDKIAAENKMKKLNEAYEILSDPVKRKSYDEELEASEKAEEISTSSPLEEKIQLLISENDILRHNIQNYNRFIYEYFYEQADDVFNTINNYDIVENSFSHNASLNNNFAFTTRSSNLTYKDFFMSLLKKIGMYAILVIFILALLSFSFNINFFDILFKTFFSK